jgi:hypothetical protein
MDVGGADLEEAGVEAVVGVGVGVELETGVDLPLLLAVVDV